MTQKLSLIESAFYNSQKSFSKSIIDYSEMAKKKVTFIVRKYMAISQNQNAMALSYELQEECKRLWQYNLVIQRQARISKFLM